MSESWRRACNLTPLLMQHEEAWGSRERERDTYDPLATLALRVSTYCRVLPLIRTRRVPMECGSKAFLGRLMDGSSEWCSRMCKCREREKGKEREGEMEREGEKEREGGREGKGEGEGAGRRSQTETERMSEKFKQSHLDI